MAVEVDFLTGTSTNNINTNFQRVKEALQETVGRTGDSPNQMEVDLDLNGNDLLNVGLLEVGALTIDGESQEGFLQRIEEAVLAADASADAAAQSAIEAAEAAAGAGVSDGDKGEVVVSDEGTIWAIADGVIDKDKFEENVLRKFDRVYSPFDYGGVGDGVADDANALNAMFAQIRADVLGAASRSGMSLIPFSVDLGGGYWRTTQSINATGIVAWSWEIKGGVLIGECTGKAILDLVGSRGYAMRSVGFYGDKTNRPACAYQLARPTAGGFCDNQSFEDVATTGWFSRAAIHCYAHETATHLHCTYFNYDHTARVAIFEGYDAHPFTSDYSTVMSGSTSFINNKVINCDFRYLPVGDNVAAITGMTTGANAVVTVASHAFEVGDEVVFAWVGGMPNLNTAIGTVTAVTPTTITTNVNTTSMGTFTTGGNIIRRQEQSSVYLARTSQFNFDCSYIVAYGQPQLELGFPDNTFARMEQLDLDLLFEGSGNKSNILFTNYGQNVTVQGFRLKTYHSNAVNCLLDANQDDPGAITIYHPMIESVERLFAPTLVNAAYADQFAMYGADLLYSNLNDSVFAAMASFNGKITTIANGKTYDINEARYGKPIFEGGITTPTAGSIVAYMTVSYDGTDYKMPLYASS